MNKYSETYYKKNLKGSLSSAEVIVPTIIKLVSPKSVVDVGCGVGTWLSIFVKYGIKDILGIDGNYINRQQLLIDTNSFYPVDLNTDFKLKKRYDLAVCLEVAEHLPRNSAKTIVKNLVRLSDVVLFSAAIPYQGGKNHLNEQWPEYWCKFFKKRGYTAVDCIRKKVWNDKRVEYWYAQNSLVFVDKNKLSKYPILLKERGHTSENQLSLVHPSLYLYWGNSLSKLSFALRKRIKILVK